MLPLMINTWWVLSVRLLMIVSTVLLSYHKLDVLSAKAERGLPPVIERENERERERERDSLIYNGTVLNVYMLINLWSVLKRCHF